MDRDQNHYREIKHVFLFLTFVNFLQNILIVDSRTTPPFIWSDDDNRDRGFNLTNHQKFTECTKIKRIEDCLPVLYSTAILAIVTTFLLTLCGAFICCMVCCAARWRSRELRERIQFTGYALVSRNRSSTEHEYFEPYSPTESSQFSPKRFNPDPPPKYPGPLLKEPDPDRRSVEEDLPPPPYTPSLCKPQEENN